MVFDSDGDLIALERRALLPIDARRLRVVCRSGRVWITALHGADVVLETGQSCDIVDGENVLVQALRNAVIAIGAPDSSSATQADRALGSLGQAMAMRATNQRGRPNSPAC